jgi:hypothetical protein
MKTRHRREALTFGEFIVAAYDVYGKSRARTMVRRAVNTHMVVFRRPQRVVIT